ncbi:Asp-tRNA(Asn)/Glu-tRNA(Gln) amidotransferase subunit GatA [Clostridium beijerinckii]|jgi:aspartyl/glutamyl-tRNA(Asn/Gln) amidotransferase subunit A (EC 6.3.5.-)|uniref:Glutamyl-tRNA(Gln) amidotransferase subunit A n=2 Tax=Clostridium beijerinckii TaxID=1520 RepID=A0AAE2RSQ8_CLOBE|nr:Asp-tRNA(Asn)/Glu-tRNA(Gln) amidotransferase subunit GatA [Clostridium beijerinckii]ABR34295.1 glutamyl-tRNA(Gln) amidotransferase, A subunit [Clostridium beijerinckii NCIMB 8052]AIU00277.1 aspartyl/glutamyl-tRNA amidotransferase subunit A [Clostridium beijerinckii ATCC 35702]MBF7811095.1 Asp-tRNA(Asn)/Glu-tRNA(Gln) amidotransferase subunit GatA [Clostridium beijerinckii]NOW91834.1 aspartyl-tRNA(Asn)/glutamyl-tRNA(Gln) amidotransferase subunit A [Clostridium beijerinckii]NRT24396.1 aspartyl
MQMNIKEMVEKIKSRELTSEALVQSYIEEITKNESTINAFLTLTCEEALAKAKEIDAKVKAGESLGRLAGIPIAIKDNICTEGVNTTCASKMLEDFIPPYDATVIKKLLAEDAIIIGKTNMDEFAMGSSNENSAFKKTLNPRDTTRVPGGSSGGSAAAVAAKFAPVSLGSDTGGSIRQPAAFCGVVGLKPTYGLVSRFGLIAFGSSLDQIGPFSNSVEDSAYILNIISGTDEYDSTSIRDLKEIDYTASLQDGIKGMKIGVPEEFFGEGLDEEIKESVKNSLEKLKELGAEVETFSLPIIKDGLAAYYIMSSAEASTNLDRYDGIRYGYKTPNYTNLDELVENSRTEGFGAEVKRRIMLGTYALASGYYDAYYKKADAFRRKLRYDLKKTFEKYDLIVGPVSPVLPFKIGEKKADPLSMYLADIYTINVNLAGNPAISIPAGKSKEGLPIGIQLMGDMLCEEKIFKAAYSLEQALAIEL